jgi:hypothetical protein
LLEFDEAALLNDPQLEGAVLISKSADSNAYSINKYWIIDNQFIVKQYDKKPAAATAKPDKEFNFNGYKTKTLSLKPEETQGDKIKFALELTHTRLARPQFRLAFTDDRAGWAWRGLLDSASSKAASPLNPDPLLAAAFPIAVSATRSICGLWSSFDIDGTEAEVLSDIFYEILEREILTSAFTELSDETRSKMARNGVKKLLDVAIKAGLAAAFKAVTPVKEAFEAIAKKGLEPIFATEKKIKAKITEPVSQAVDKVLGLVGEKLAEHFGKKYEFIFQSALEELDVVQKSVQAVVEKKVQDVEGVLKAIAEERRENDWTWWGRNRPVSYRLYDNLYWSNWSDSDSGIYWTLAYKLMQDYQHLNQFALLEISAQLKSPKYASSSDPHSALKEVFPEVLQKLSHDLLLVTTEALVQAVNSKVSPKVDEHINPLLESLCAPAMELIPEDLLEIINPLRTANEIVEEIIGSAETKTVKIALEDLRTQLAAKIGTLSV